MARNKSEKGKHLSWEDRNYIEDALNANYPLGAIAQHLRKDPTTISKEIKRNRFVSTRTKQPQILSCANRKDCNLKNICSDTCNNLCKKCATVNCYRSCPSYTPNSCSRIERFPHVCNGCEKKMGCRLQKNMYKALVADANYRETLKSSRVGINMVPEELDKLDALISPLIKKGQSISHIYAHHKHEISCSKRSLYEYLDKNFFTARNIDLPRKVRYKPRKKQKKLTENSSFRIGRTYEDFKEYLCKNPETQVVEMDTVYGGQSGKVILTFIFRNCSFMLCILLDSCTQECVKNAVEKIYNTIGSKAFKRLFPVILTDNGSEFKNPKSIECNNNGEERTKVFYCDPMASYQKAKLEKNHTYIRYVLPKGKSFNHLTQDKITLMTNHINSTARTSLNESTPFKLAELLLKESFLKKMSMSFIHPDEVHLKPALLK